jgi:MFS family permease
MTLPDPRNSLASRPMNGAQVAVVAVTIALCALDGFDVMSISFAAPGIAQEWRIDRAALSIVLSMELAGMVVGSLISGVLADGVGRRRGMIGCLVVMTLGMVMAGAAQGIVALCLWRLVTGLGVGGMIPTLNAVAAEVSSDRRRDLSVALMSCGYPAGAIIGGSIVVLLLRSASWRSVFAFGALLSAVMIPVVWRLVPESVAWLCEARPAQALSRLNQALRRLGQPPVASLPPATRAVRAPLMVIFEPEFRVATGLVTLAYCLHVTTYYFVFKWVPKLVVDMGYSAASAAGVLVWANLGAVAGGAAIGFWSKWRPIRVLTAGSMIGCTLAVALFGRGWSLAPLSAVCALAGFCAHGGVVGLFAILARCYPAVARATGTGFTVGVGRGGAAAALVASGFLLRSGVGLPEACLLMALGSLLAAVALLLLRSDSPHSAREWREETRGATIEAAECGPQVSP